MTPNKVTISVDDALRAMEAKKKTQIMSPSPEELGGLHLDGDDGAESVTEKKTQEPDSLDSFERNISAAQANGIKWVETSENVLRTYNPRGLGSAKYFVYKNIKVCAPGMAKQIQEDEAKRHHDGTVDA